MQTPPSAPYPYVAKLPCLRILLKECSRYFQWLHNSGTFSHNVLNIIKRYKNKSATGQYFIKVPCDGEQRSLHVAEVVNELG